MTIDNDKLNTWLKNLNKRESEDLKRANLNKYDAWTEEVIIPKIIFEKFSYLLIFFLMLLSHRNLF